MRQAGFVQKSTVAFHLLPAALMAVNLLTAPATGQQLEVRSDPQAVSVAAEGRPVLVYRFGDVPAKPYVQELCTPGGINLLRDAPEDHLHHHALMFGVSVDGISFWEERAGAGRQQHAGFETQRAETRDGRGRAVLVESVRWLAPQSDEPLLVELRTIEVLQADALPATLLTWEARLTNPADQKRVLGGSHYYGLGMRFVEAMDRDGRMFNAAGKEGESVRGSERLVEARWAAYSAAVDGKPVTAVLFDHPDNPRQPARMFTMTAPFAYLSATMNLWKEPLAIEPGQTLRLRYAAAVGDGHLEAEQVEQLYRQWLRESPPAEAAQDGTQ
ncbi:MAG: PmoA family protein [Thermoguttaceae bacterium]|jgi:hypothetical protein|nr:PmoA family protein [Thermoguttaceae bacterium]